MDYEGFTLPMAILDIVPVVLFALAGFRLAGALYNKMTSREYAMFSCGVGICLFSAGARLIWKFLLVLRICNYTTIAEAFYPTQACAFVLMSIALQSMLVQQKKQIRLNCSVLPVGLAMLTPGLLANETNTADVITESMLPASDNLIPEYSEHMPFLAITTLFMTYFSYLLGCITVKVDKKIGILYIVMEYVGFLALGYIGAQANVHTSAMYHWFAEFSNVFAEAFFLLAVNTMIKGGLREENSLKSPAPSQETIASTQK